MRRTIIICLLLFASLATAASLQWNASVVDEDHAAPTGYRIHRGTAPGIYDWQEDVGLVLQWPIPDDLYGSFYWAASAYNASGSSGYSNEVFWDRAPPQQYVGATNLRASKLYQQGSKMSAWYGPTQTGLTYESSACVGERVTAGESGNITKLRIYVEDKGTANIKLALYDTSGNLLSSGGTLANASITNESWNNEITLGTPISITSGQTVIVWGRWSAEIQHGVGADAANTGVYITGITYAAFPPATISKNESGRHNCLGLYIESSGGASAVPVSSRFAGMDPRGDRIGGLF